MSTESSVGPAVRPTDGLGHAASGEQRVPHWLRALLGVPLTVKLVGANLLVGLVAVAVVWTRHGPAGRAGDTVVVLAALAVALLLNCALVHLALRPVRLLEDAATRVWRGDFEARVPASAVADADMRRLGRTVNLLLDSLADDRTRLRELAAQAIRVQDDERSRIARELHDSAAQTIAALTYQLAAAARDSRDPALAARLTEIREMAGDVLEEVRLLSHTVHPRVLDDLGLVPALEWLARTTHEHGGPPVDVEARIGDAAAALPKLSTSTLYRVAQESLRNAERHAEASRVVVTVERQDGDVVLEVADNGRGFDLAEAAARRPGMGLFAMRERLGLVGGSLDIVTAPAAGTRVRARVPGDTSRHNALELHR